MADPVQTNYYDVLGVAHTATAEDVKSAFLKLAAEYHAQGKPPNIAEVERLRNIVRAYRILSDSEQRSRYDRLGETGVDPEVVSTGYDPEFFEKWTIDARTLNLIPVNDWPSDFIEYVKNRPIEFEDKD